MMTPSVPNSTQWLPKNRQTFRQQNHVGSLNKASKLPKLATCLSCRPATILAQYLKSSFQPFGSTFAFQECLILQTTNERINVPSRGPPAVFTTFYFFCPELNEYIWKKSKTPKRNQTSENNNIFENNSFRNPGNNHYFN